MEDEDYDDSRCYHCDRPMGEHTLSQMRECAKRTAISEIMDRVRTDHLPEEGEDTLWQIIFQLGSAREVRMGGSVARVSESRARDYLAQAIEGEFTSSEDWVTLLRWLWLEGFIVGYRMEG